MNAKPIHGESRPLHEVRGLETEPPIACYFKLGDWVTYTNDQGVKFGPRQVIGFAKTVQSWGGFIHLDHAGWWCPVTAKSLKPFGA